MMRCIDMHIYLTVAMGMICVGVVISIVSTTQDEGYALLLDAASFEEIARVRFPYGLPYGFHGCWIPEKI